MFVVKQICLIIVLHFINFEFVSRFTKNTVKHFCFTVFATDLIILFNIA